MTRSEPRALFNRPPFLSFGRYLSLSPSPLFPYLSRFYARSRGLLACAGTVNACCRRLAWNRSSRIPPGGSSTTRGKKGKESPGETFTHGLCACIFCTLDGTMVRLPFFPKRSARRALEPFAQKLQHTHCEFFTFLRCCGCCCFICYPPGLR